LFYICSDEVAMTLTHTDMPRRCRAPGAVAALLRESRTVELKPLLANPAPLAALPPPGGEAARPAAHAVMTADDLRPDGPNAGDCRRAPSRPRALTGQSFGDGFRYWYGRSGRRYLFSEMPGDDEALNGAVVLVAGADADRPAYVGLDRPPAVHAGAPVFVHLLAETAAERAAVIADLAPRAA
jgi:hypothetical protein